ITTAILPSRRIPSSRSLYQEGACRRARRYGKRAALQSEERPMKQRFAAAAIGGVLLAQLGPPGSYNLNVLATPGTMVPESNPATAIVPPAPKPPPSTPSGPATTSTDSWAPPMGTTSGPAYSFGAAPPPVIAPGK